MTITRNFKLCLNAGTQNAPYINVNQYDEGEEWVFDLYTEGGQKFTPSSGAIIGIKADGNAILNAGTVNASGQVVITETQQMTAASGLAVFELLIEGETHGTANFIVNVERRPSDDAEFSDSDLSMLQEAIDAAEVINEILDEGGDPSEIIAENVDAWLDNHPEATTTVEDGAITAPKINNSLWDKILVNEEASGNPASFEDGADDVPVSSLKVAIEPIQTGSGDPSPTNIRPIIASNGKNLLQVTATTQTISGVTFTVDNGIITANGTATEALNLFVAQGLSIAGGTLSGCPSGGSTSTYYMNGRVNGSWNARDTGSGATFTGTLDQVAITIASGYTCNNLVFKPMIRLASITDSTYQPYQGIMVERCGINQWDEQWENGEFNTNTGVPTSSGTRIRSKNFIPIQPSYEYYAFANTNAAMYLFFYDANQNYLGFHGDSIRNRAFVPSQLANDLSGGGSFANAKYMKFRFDSTPYNNDISINYPSTITDYHAYAGTSYPISLGRAVYGGSVDLATGVLTVDRVMVDLGSLTWTAASSGFYATVPSCIADEKNSVCSAYKFVPTANWASAAHMSGDLADGQYAWYTNLTRTFFKNSNYASEADFKTAVTGQQLVYTLATPQTIQLTPQEVKTLLGYNNISSSGTVDVIYHADTKLYIDKKIGELS